MFNCSSTNSPRSTRWLAVAAMLPLACSPGSRSSSQAPPMQSAHSTKLYPLTIEPTPISLGEIEPGQSASAEVVVRNATDDAIGPVRLRTSCPCVDVTPRSVSVDAHGATKIRIVFDPREDPGFRGQLAVNLVGKRADEGVVFRNRSVPSWHEI